MKKFENNNLSIFPGILFLIKKKNPCLKIQIFENYD